MDVSAARTRLTAILLVLGVLVAACGNPAHLDLAEVAGDASAPPADAHLADADAATAAAWIVDEVRRTDRPVVVKFFASWCGPCEEEAPILLDALDEHPQVAMVGIDHQDRREAAASWVREHGLDAIPTLFDPEGLVARRFGARGMPSVSFVDATGTLLHTHTGPIDRDLLDAWIDHLSGGGPRPADRPDAPASDTPAAGT